MAYSTFNPAFLKGTLVDGNGEHKVTWIAESSPAGIYSYPLQVENQVVYGKIVKMK